MDETTVAFGRNDGGIWAKRGNTSHDMAETPTYKGFEAWEVLL